MPDSPALILVLVVLAALLLIALIVALSAWRRGRTRIEGLLSERERALAEARKDSVERSRSTLKGQIAEQLAPLLPGFRYLPADARFLGDPVDYIVFGGYTGIRDAGASPDSMELVLLEVKQGTSALSGTQRAIARSVEEGRVRFEVLRIAEDGGLTTESWKPRKAGGARR
jgi:predicted Holliday junction resolvase-like endonuclease